MAKKAFEVELSAKTSGLKKAFKEIDKESRKITKELRKVNRGLYFNPKSAELLSQKTELLGNRINETRKKLNGLKKAEKDMKKAFEKGDLGAKEYREFKREIVTTENKLGNFNRQLKETKKQATNAKYNLDGLKSAASTLATGITATAAGLIAMGIVVGREINKTMEYADEVDKLSQQIGLSREATQEWTFVAEQNGSSIESLSAGIQRFTRNVGNAADGGNKYSEILSDIGVEIKDTDNSLRSMNDIFPETIKQLASMEKGTERNAAVMELFGRRGSELIPILNQSEEDIAALIKQANDLDLVMDEEDIQSWVDMKDKIHALTEQFSALKREMVNDLLPFLQLDLLPFIDEKLLPSIEKITDAFSYGWTSFSYEGGEDAKKAIQSIKDLSTAQDLLAEKQKELADTKSIEELSTWEKISMSAEEKQSLHERRRLLEDEVQLLEYRVENWSLLNSEQNKNNKNKEKTTSSISDLEKFNAELEKMISNRKDEQDIASRDTKLSQTVRRFEIEKEALKERARELNASNATLEKIDKLFVAKQEQAIKEANRKEAELEKELQNEIALLKKEGLEKELEQLTQQEKAEKEAAKGKENAIDEIEEKYRIKRQKAKEKYAEKEKKLQDEIMENRLKVNDISAAAYRNYLRERLKDYKKFSNEHDKIRSKIEKSLAETGGSGANDFSANLAALGRKGREAQTGYDPTPLKKEAESLNWLTDGFVDLGYEIETANEMFGKWKKDLSEGLSEAIVQGKSLGDVFDNLVKKMAEMALQKAVIDPFLNWGFGKIGLPAFHEGGYVNPANAIANIKKFHSGGGYGLKPNEQPAILEYGERVLTEDQNKTLETMDPNQLGGSNYHITINAVDSQSFQQAIQRNPEAIVNVITQDIMRNGNTRKVIKKY